MLTPPLLSPGPPRVSLTHSARSGLVVSACRGARLWTSARPWLRTRTGPCTAAEAWPWSSTCPRLWTSARHAESTLHAKGPPGVARPLAASSAAADPLPRGRLPHDRDGPTDPYRPTYATQSPHRQRRPPSTAARLFRVRQHLNRAAVSSSPPV